MGGADLMVNCSYRLSDPPIHCGWCCLLLLQRGARYGMRVTRIRAYVTILSAPMSPASTASNSGVHPPALSQPITVLPIDPRRSINMTTRGTSMLIPPNIVLYHSVFFLNQRRGAYLVTPLPPLIQEGSPCSRLSSIRATWSWKEVDRASRACEDCS